MGEGGAKERRGFFDTVSPPQPSCLSLPVSQDCRHAYHTWPVQVAPRCERASYVAPSLHSGALPFVPLQLGHLLFNFCCC